MLKEDKNALKTDIERLNSLENLKKVILMGYASVALIILGLIFYYVEWWTLYLSVLGFLLYFPCAVWLSRRKENSRINLHFQMITIVNGAAFLFLFIIPHLFGLIK